VVSEFVNAKRCMDARLAYEHSTDLLLCTAFGKLDLSELELAVLDRLLLLERLCLEGVDELLLHVICVLQVGELGAKLQHAKPHVGRHDARWCTWPSQV
jgi:hypothetical protein